MKLKLTIISLLISIYSFSQKPTNLFKIEPKINQTVQYSSNLNLGKKINDLSWAWKSTNACFPATKQNSFNGNHVFFTGIIPKKAIYKIKLIPKNKNANFSLYAYEIDVNSTDLVPNLPKCNHCFSDSFTKATSSLNKNNKYIREVRNNTASDKNFRLIIGVVGANKLSKGEFSLEIQLNKK